MFKDISIGSDEIGQLSALLETVSTGKVLGRSLGAWCCHCQQSTGEIEALGVVGGGGRRCLFRFAVFFARGGGGFCCMPKGGTWTGETQLANHPLCTRTFYLV